jgi:pyruvate formate lyase activating enzyme
VEEVLAEVRKDIPFYLASGGGVTLSGGEPTMQGPFARRLLQDCREEGIHTALETCGHVEWSVFEALLPHLNQILYDIKHMNSSRHVQLTGVPNRLILKNARRLAESGATMIIRLAVIPDKNDSDDNISQLIEFVNELPGRLSVDLLPYHGYGSAKYDLLCRRYPLAQLEPPTLQQLLRLRDQMRARGLGCAIV